MVAAAGEKRAGRLDHRRGLQRQARDDDRAGPRRPVDVSDEALSKTLSQLRPWALMLVIASAEEYIEDMLTALRA